MGGFDIHTGASEISLEDHLTSLDENSKTILNELRDFVMSLGPNIVEQIRLHRIVYGKLTVFRWFLDIRPMKNQLIASVKADRKSPPKEITLQSREQLPEVKMMIKEAYARLQ